MTVEETLGARKIVQVPEEELGVVASADSDVILIDLDLRHVAIMANQLLAHSLVSSPQAESAIVTPREDPAIPQKSAGRDPV